MKTKLAQLKITLTNENQPSQQFWAFTVGGPEDKWPDGKQSQLD